MVIFSIIISLFIPRILSVILFFYSGWFRGIFETWYWPFLGFVFLPHTMLWYSAVMNWWGGQWEFMQIFILVIAILWDLGFIGFFGKKSFS